MNTKMIPIIQNKDKQVLFYSKQLSSIESIHSVKEFISILNDYSGFYWIVWEKKEESWTKFPTI